MAGTFQRVPWPLGSISWGSGLFSSRSLLKEHHPNNYKFVPQAQEPSTLTYAMEFIIHEHATRYFQYRQSRPLFWFN